MSGVTKSRWAQDDAESAAAEAQRKREKEEKKRAKAEKQRRLEEVRAPEPSSSQVDGDEETLDRPTKRRKVTPEGEASTQRRMLRFPAAEWGPCRHVDNFERLNHIEEGSYGWVSRAKEVGTGEIVALKKLKMDNSNDGFPVTGLREIQTLMESDHPNIVSLREIVMGDSLSE